MLKEQLTALAQTAAELEGLGEFGEVIGGEE
jgi:hypothetical protein